jgi:protoporphyrinogen/coproporphyrinogen III oxidase
VVADVLIVGGGISGLATAYYVRRQGLSAAIIEGSKRLGGLIGTETISGCRLELGPDSWIANKTAIVDLARSIPGLGEQIIGSNDAARRIFVVKDGQLAPLPHGMVMMVPGEWGPALRSRLFDSGTKLKFLSEYFQRPRTRRDDVSIAEFVKDHFDEAMLEYVTEPLLSGVYGGLAGKLSASSVLPRFVGYEQKYGSLIRGVRQERRSAKKKQPTGSLFQSFRNGMQTLVDALSDTLLAQRVRILQGHADRVEPMSGGGWRVRVGEESEEAAQVVLACPAYRAAALVKPASAPLSAELGAIPYSSAITVMTGFRRDAVGHALDGFGFLVPRRERKTLAACTWVSTKFPTRVAPEYAVLRSFLVDPDADELMLAPDEELIDIVRSELKSLMGITAPVAFYTVNRWPHSMPQYVVGHEARWLRIEEQMRNHPGLHLVGNAYDGVGVPDCVRLAKDAALRIARHAKRGQVEYSAG